MHGQYAGDEQQLSDLDADVEHQQRDRDRLLRQTDLRQRARKPKAMQQPEREGDDPWGARGESRAPAVDKIHANETTTARRYRDVFLGGMLIIFGARLAGGCTSGHIISGMTQLAVSGVLFAAAVFASGLLTARLIKGDR